MLVLVFFVLSFVSYSQDTLNHKFGIYGGMNLNNHTADFNKLAEIPNCCPEFREGTGNGINIGILYEMRLGRVLWLGTRLGILSLDGILKNEELTTIITPSGTTDGILEHKLEGKFSNIGIEPSLIYNPIGNVLINVGIRAGLNISSKYDQVETITKPEGVGTFLDAEGNDTGLRTRNKYNGDIPNAVSLQLFASGGISYELPLNKSNSLRATPELQYYFPITELVENTKWKVNSLRLGLAIKYAPIPKPPKQKLFERQYEIDTIEIPNELITQRAYRKGGEITRNETNEDDNTIVVREIISRIDTIYIPKSYRLNGQITIVGLDTLGVEIPKPRFIVEEFVSNRLDPLLNYVFFDENTYKLPTRYKKLNLTETNEFEIEQLFYDSTLQIYHNLLNIIGKRMRENPTASITLIGCNSDIGMEKGNIDLSKKRAEEVKSYLTSVWGIDEKRIKVETRNLPQKASTPISEPDKIAENRRVEIYSDNPKIIAPIFIEKIDRQANPPIVRFKLVAESEAGLKNWMVVGYQNTAKTNKFEHKQEGTIRQELDWELEQYQKIIPKYAEPIIGELHLEDNKGSKHKSQTQSEPLEIISIQQKRVNKIGDYEVEKFSLILFDFDKSAIDGQNQKITDFIKERIKPNSEIEILGYTDRTGSVEYNKNLSQRRANATKEALKRTEAKSQGIGQEKLLYDNDLPEGRFYCRTVEIIVKTKIKGE